MMNKKSMGEAFEKALQYSAVRKAGVRANQTINHLGGMGKRGSALEGAAQMELGRKRAAYIGGGFIGMSALGHHSSSSKGLQPKSSAPPPGGGYNPYSG